MDEQREKIELEKQKENELKVVKTKDLPKVKAEIEKAKENAKKLYEMEDKYIEVPTLHDGLNKKIKEVDKQIKEREMQEIEPQEVKAKKPSIFKRIWRGIAGFFKRLFGKKKQEEGMPENLQNKGESIEKTSQKRIEDDEYDIQMKEVDDRQDK